MADYSELVEKLRFAADHVAFVPHMHHEAADAIEALQREVLAAEARTVETPGQKMIRGAQEALAGYEAHMLRMQKSCIRYLTDRMTKTDFVNAMIYLLDGPEQREVQERARAALRAIAGESHD